jgi:uncharacterized protein
MPRRPASRIPYHSEVTPAKLRQIDEAEAVPRHDRRRRASHGRIARIEVPVEQIARLRRDEVWPAVEVAIVAAGFDHVEIDARGFRSGRLNESLARPS